MKSIFKVYTIFSFILLLTLASCKKNNYEYEIINDFIVSNNIKIINLDQSSYCFNELNLNNSEIKHLDINLKNDKCNEKIDLRKIKFYHDDSILRSKISFPLFSNDDKYVYIIVNSYYWGQLHVSRTDIVYKLMKVNKHWKIIDEYKIMTTT